MIRTTAAFAVAALTGLVALRIAFGIFGGALALVFVLLGLLVKVGCALGAAYFALSMISPDSAKRVREALGFDGARRPL